MQRRPKAGTVAILVAATAFLASHVAPALGQGYGWTIVLTAIQALAEGVVLWSMLRSHRWLAPAAATILLCGLALGAWVSPPDGPLAVSGLSHAMLYATLLILFGATLRPGRTALATHFAARLNPSFHPGMIPYTRRVTLAWCLLFAAQLATSAALLALRSPWWPAFVTLLHLVPVIAMALLEFAIRRWRWRHEHYTSFADTLRGVRRIARQRASSSSIE